MEMKTISNFDPLPSHQKATVQFFNNIPSIISQLMEQQIG